MKKLLLLLWSFLTASVGMAHIRLPAVIGSNMVLQQRSSVRLWGWGNPTEKILVTTSWDGRTDSVAVNENAKWELAIQTPPAGGPFTIKLQGDNLIELTNVLVGEVWICSGQSNMEMNYHWGLPQMRDDIKNAAAAPIRLFGIPRTTATAPQENCTATWTLCDSVSVKSFSAVGYYFGKRLQAALKVPVGLISASWGGTPAEVWTPAHLVTGDSLLHAAAKKQTPSSGWPITPGATYNGMIEPVKNFRIAGAIWYQGESNVGTASSYDSLFRTMISAWRQAWGYPFPFYFVQLAPFHYGNGQTGALLREQQSMTLSLPGTGMIVTTDLAHDTLDIHPKNKRDVGWRLADLALQETYGWKRSEAKSPTVEKVHFANGAAAVTVANLNNGLIIKGQKVSGLFLAGSDQRFYPASGIISGRVIVVRSPNVPKPVAVRYAFSNTAVGNLFSSEGLPLTPFRSDSWEVNTPGRF